MFLGLDTWGSSVPKVPTLSSRPLNTKKLLILQSELQLSSTIAFEPPFQRQESLYISLTDCVALFQSQEGNFDRTAFIRTQPTLVCESFTVPSASSGNLGTLWYTLETPLPHSRSTRNPSIFRSNLSSGFLKIQATATGARSLAAASQQLVWRSLRAGWARLLRYPTGHGL